jgi:xanthine dehydrogenase accessory factor
MPAQPAAPDLDRLADLDSLTPVPDICDVALPLRLLLLRGVSFALATVMGAQGVAVRRVGTVMVVPESGEAIGFSHCGCLDGAIRDLATEVLATGTGRLERFEIDEDAASYIGLAGRISLDVHAMCVAAGDRWFERMLRYLDRGGPAVVLIGIRGVSGCAAIGPDRVAGRLSWAELPQSVIVDARRMLGRPSYARKNYGLGGEWGRNGAEVWMESHLGGLGSTERPGRA